MSDYIPYSVVPYNPRGPIDPEWEKSIELAMNRAQARGDLKHLQNSIKEYVC